MGVCCSKNSGSKTISANSRKSGLHHARSYHDEEEGEDNVIRGGDFGASVRLSGSSTFVSMDTRHGKKLNVNQDALTVWEDFTGEKDVIFCGVFDGHGPNGHKVAHKVRDSLPSKLANYHKTLQRRAAILNSSSPQKEDHSGSCSPVDDRYCENPLFDQWKTTFLSAFKEMDKDLHYDPVLDTYSSGATGLTVVKQGDNLMIGNLGDSRAVLCTRGEKGPIPIQLTVDLKPSLPCEAERITYCSGRVFALDSEPEILRVWQAEKKTPGLAISRSFGDFCLKDYGLISIPQLFYRKITEEDEFVVVASDGLWNVLSNLEVVRIVSSAKSRSMAAKLLVACATRAWERRYPKMKADDISAICLFFKPPPATPPVRSMSAPSPALASPSPSPPPSSRTRRRSLSGYYRVSKVNDRFLENRKIRDGVLQRRRQQRVVVVNHQDNEPKLKSILKTPGTPSPRLIRQQGVRKVRFQEIVEIKSVAEEE